MTTLPTTFRLDPSTPSCSSARLAAERSAPWTPQPPSKHALA
jgi:hypothetical protein